MRAYARDPPAFTTKSTKKHEAMRQSFCPRRAAKGREAMRQTHFAARLRVPSCPFVVKPQPQGFAFLRGPTGPSSY